MGVILLQRLKDLSYYQKAVLIVMMVMALIFAVIYPKTISRVGYKYKDSILIPIQANDTTVYSGKIKGVEACFTVTNNDTVDFKYGDRTYGTYTIKEDPTAIPKDDEMKSRLTGIEVREDEEIMFRGGIINLGGFYRWVSEDGSTDNMISFTYTASDGIERDENGNPVDKMKPSITTIYELTHNPEMTHKGEGFAWFGAVFICILNALSILFADELFRFNLLFRIRNAEYAEPSAWELTGRYIGWTIITISALNIFILGLQ